MKQFITTMLFLFAAMQTNAERVNIPLQVQVSNSSDTNGQIRHIPSRIKLPNVEIDGNVIYINSPYSDVCFTLILNDKDGNVIYTEKVIASAYMSFIIPLDITEEAIGITIYVANKAYYGKF